MRRAILSLTLLPLTLMAASPASAGGLDIRLGAFFPRARDCGIPSSEQAQYTLFQDVCELYSTTKEDWTGFTWGIEYNHVLAKNVELALHVDGYSRSVDTFYRDWTRPDGSDIFQTLRLQIVPFGMTVQFVPTSKRAKVAPFVGGGIDLFYYKYEEMGDFIDFWDPNLEIWSDHFISTGVAFGFHATGVVRGVYQWAADDMGGDFSPTEPGLINRIDLTGPAVTFGLHVRF